MSEGAPWSWPDMLYTSKAIVLLPNVASLKARTLYILAFDNSAGKRLSP